MPAGVTVADRNLLLITGASALLAIVVGTVGTTNVSDTSDVPTTYSVGSGGAKAAFLLLGRAGYSVQRWEERLDRLPADGQTTLIVADPEEAPTPQERAALARFIERGGRVIATGMSGALFLPAHAVVADPRANLTWRRLSARSPSAAARVAPGITMAPQGHWDSTAFAVPLYGDDDGLRVVEYPVARGEAVWWAGSTPLTNAGLREPGNLEFLLASIGTTGTRVLWNEYVHGHRGSSPGSPLMWPFRWIGLQLALVAAAVLLTFARRSGPIIAEATHRGLSPLEFVETLGSLYERAGAASAAVDIAYQRFRYALGQRLGVPANTSIDDLERAVSDRWGPPASTLGSLLRSVETARRDARLSADNALGLNRALHDRASEMELFRKRL